jgi:hypothetical protein
MRRHLVLSAILLAATATCRADAAPSIVETPDGRPPEGAVVLFDGKGTNLFLSKRGEECDWPVVEGALVSTSGDVRARHIVSKLHFRDAQIHVEFMLPEAEGGRRYSGNSGVYLHGHYELQVFNSFGKEGVSKGDCGAIYGIAPPLTGACRKPGEWQTYDILYLAPRRNEAGKIVEPGSITAKLNGQLVQDDTRFEEPTSTYHPLRYKTTPYTDRIKEKLLATGTGPVFLQDHDNPVRFRNVWLLPLDDKAGMFEPPPGGEEAKP